jgi:ABC-type multidrug transport system permease subunit
MSELILRWISFLVGITCILAIFFSISYGPMPESIRQFHIEILVIAFTIAAGILNLWYAFKD